MESINQTVKYQLFVVARPRYMPQEGESPWTVRVSTYNPVELDGGDSVLLETIDKEITIDSEYDIRTMQLDLLKAEKAELLAKHHVAVIALDEKINSLLAIEHQGDDS